MKYLLLQLLILILFSSIACRKHKQYQPDNPYGLPDATQNGANVFACRINGQNFIAFNDNDHLGSTFHSDTLRVAGMPKKSYLQTILVQLTSNVSEGNTYLINNTNIVGRYITDSLCNGLFGNVYQFGALNGSVQVTKFDKSNRIVSAKFNFIVPITNCDTLKITDGRFDVRFN